MPVCTSRELTTGSHGPGTPTACLVDAASTPPLASRAAKRRSPCWEPCWEPCPSRVPRGDPLLSINGGVANPWAACLSHLRACFYSREDERRGSRWRVSIIAWSKCEGKKTVHNIYEHIGGASDTTRGGSHVHGAPGDTYRAS